MQSTKTTIDHNGPPAAAEHAEGIQAERAALRARLLGLIVRNESERAGRRADSNQTTRRP